MVAKVLALIEEAVAGAVDKDAHLVVVKGGDAAFDPGRAGIEDCGVVIAPLAGGLGAGIDGHADALAGVVAAAAEDERVGEAAQVAHAHLDVRLEAATGEDDTARGVQVNDAFGAAGADARDGSIAVDDEVDGAGFVRDDAAEAFEPPVEEVDQALAAGFRAATVAGGVGVAGLPFEAHGGEPFGRIAGVFAEGTDEPGVGASAGDAHEVVEHVVDRVVARAELVGFVGEAHLGIGEAGIATAALGRGLFHEDDIGAGLAGGDGRREAGDAAANDKDASLVGGGCAGGFRGYGHGEKSTGRAGRGPVGREEGGGRRALLERRTSEAGQS